MIVEWHDWIGGIGAAVLLTTYLLLQINWMKATSMRYSVLNAIGSGGILISLSQDFNMSAFVIEVCWLLISIVGACVTMRNWRKSSRTTMPKQGLDTKGN